MEKENKDQREISPIISNKNLQTTQRTVNFGYNIFSLYNKALSITKFKIKLDEK